jgi:hypothetical protein
MAHFINFEEILVGLRKGLDDALTQELKEHNKGLTNPLDISEADVPLYFIHPTELDGRSKASSIFTDFAGVVIKTEVGECIDFTDLETDDMLAIYEYVYYELN